MRIALLSICEPATGNTTSSDRIGRYLEDADHTVTYIPVESDRDEVKTIFKTQSIDCAIGLHAYGAGKHLHDAPIPYALLLCNSDFNVYPEDPIKMPIMTKAIENAQQCMCYDQNSADTIQGIWPELTKDIIVIPKGFNLTPSTFSLKNHLHISDNEHLFILPSGLRPMKDPDFLSDVMDPWHLAILGTTRDEEYAHWIKDKHANSPNIHILDPIPSPDLYAAMKESTAVLNTSHHEGACNAILEALSLGCTVMARNIPGNAAIITHENNGLLFDTPQQWRELAEQLIDDETLQKRLSENAIGYMKEHHDKEKEKKTYIDLIASIS